MTSDISMKFCRVKRYEKKMLEKIVKMFNKILLLFKFDFYGAVKIRWIVIRRIDILPNSRCVEQHFLPIIYTYALNGPFSKNVYNLPYPNFPGPVGLDSKPHWVRPVISSVGSDDEGKVRLAIK